LNFFWQCLGAADQAGATRVEPAPAITRRRTPAIVEADEDQIQQLLVNLVLNALDAMPDEPPLRLRSARPASHKGCRTETAGRQWRGRETRADERGRLHRYNAEMPLENICDEKPSASLLQLQRRAQLMTVLRSDFRDAGYWEVETPILSSEIVLDAWLEPFVAGYCSDPPRWRGGGEPRYLQTSPEAHMKRLLAAGADAIFQVSRVFRNGELGRRHNPEFTMLEWYRVGDDHHAQMAFVEQLVRSVWTASAAWREISTVPDVAAPFERITYDEAFERFAGERVLSATRPQLHALASRHRLVPPAGLDADDRDGWLNFLLAELIEPRLGVERPAFLYNYPASQSALARVGPSRPGGPLVAERFELYLRGVEVCNGYHELLDAEALRERTRQQAALRDAAGLRTLPAPERLMAAMQSGLPACSGVALGVDRLMMLALGAESIAEVIAFPFDRA
jgi:lysyl-tRNA synthetase class 2